MADLKTGWEILSEDWGNTLSYGLKVFLISLIPVFGQFYVIGLYLDLIKDDKKSIPDSPWEDPGRRFVDGAKLGIGTTIYAIAIIALVIMGASVNNDTLSSILAALGIIMAIIITPYLNIITTHYAHNRKFSELFKVGLAKYILTFNFWKTVGYILLYGFAASLVALVPAAGQILVLLMTWPLQVVAAKYYGDWYRENVK